MNKKHISDGVLVYDRFYGAKPKILLQALKKLLLCCSIAIFGMLYILTEYDLPVSLQLMAGVTAGSCAVLSVLFIFFKRRFAVPVLALIAAIITYTEFEKIRDTLSYFADAMLMLVDGRFLDPRSVLIHEEALLNAHNPFYVSGVTFGCIILCVCFAFVCAFSFARKIQPVPAMAVFGLLCVPRLISESLEFNVWFIPFAAVCAAAVAINICYKDGIAVKGVGADYLKAVSADERSFRVNAANADYAKRVEMHIVHYSKYFSVGVYCAVVFAVTLGAASVYFKKGSSIDYSKAYDFISGIGNDSGITASPFDEGPVSEYFATPKKTDSSNTLSIISPGRGEQEIIRVKYTGTEPIYLRGDIGIDFTGNSWTSPVNDEFATWRERVLAEYYRPCEGRVIHSLLETRNSDTSQLISSSVITIDYMCETSVVFLPPYTAEYGYYNNEQFNVYGDFVVRVNEDFDNVNTVMCTAVIPAYTDTDNTTDGISALSEIVSAFSESMCNVSDIYRTVVPEMDTGGINVISEYCNFAESEYIRIPDPYKQALVEFMAENGMMNELSDRLLSYDTTAESRYAAAKYIADYLRDNYSYSLNAKNSLSDPVFSFLNTTKSGHCSLYASSMTLMLRALGIPARYCTGFMIDPSESESDVQVMRAKNLHAWCEVYLGELGWATFDPTSSSVYAGDGNSPEKPGNLPEQTTHITTSVSHAVVTPRPQTSGSNQISSGSHITTTKVSTEPGSSESKIDWQALKPFIIAGSVVLVILVVLISVGYYLHRLKLSAENRFRLVQIGDISDSCREIYGLMLKILALYGCVPSRGELPAAFFERVDKEFGTSVSDDIELIEALAFGTPECTEGNRVNMLHHLMMLYAKAGKRNAPVKRIRMRKLLCSK